MLGGRGMEQVREFETADGRRGRRRIPVLAPFEFFASSRLIRAQFHREGAKCARRNKFTFWRERRAGRCEAPRRRRCRTSSRSGNEADARPSPPRTYGLRPAGTLALLLAPHIPPRV